MNDEDFIITYITLSNGKNYCFCEDSNFYEELENGKLKLVDKNSNFNIIKKLEKFLEPEKYDIVED